MARTVDEGFNTFLSWLTPTGTETENAKNHRASIEACLKSNFGLLRFFRIGSFGNGTSVSWYSDVDYIASIPRSNLKQSSTAVLQEIKNALDGRFPNTGVRVDPPAVVVPFGKDRAETTEIVPGDFIESDHGCSTYDIPDGLGGWKRANPEFHKLYIDNRDSDLKKKVKPLIRFIKAWKYYQSVPISSFYLEMYVGVYAEKEQSILYSIDVNRLFENLKSNKLAPLHDPFGISGDISPCKNESERMTALSKLDDAARRSSSARAAEGENDIAGAFAWWNLVYNDLFPSYY
jgi:hypothetical protein